MDREKVKQIMQAVAGYRAASIRAFTANTAAEVAVPGSVIIDAAQAATEVEAHYRRTVESMLAEA